MKLSSANITPYYHPAQSCAALLNGRVTHPSLLCLLLPCYCRTELAKL